MTFTRNQKTWIFLGIVILVIGFVNLYTNQNVLLQSENFLENTTDVSPEEEARYYKNCYEQHCIPIENEYKRQCEKIRLKCAEQHLFNFEKCKEDVLNVCNTSDIDNCSLTCKNLWSVEKKNRLAQVALAKQLIGTILQKDSVDLAIEKSKQVLAPPINFYAGPEYTLEFELNPENPSTSWRTILFFTSSNNMDRTPAVWLHPGTTGMLHVRQSSQSTPLGIYVNSLQNAIQFNRWTHIVLVVSKTEMSLYINGILQAVQKLAFGDTFVWGKPTDRYYYMRHPLSIEQHVGKTQIRNIQWFTRSLKEEEIQQLYNSKK